MKTLPVLKKHQARWKSCRDCEFGSTTTTRPYYRGDSKFPLHVLFVGDAPGRNDDLVGEPFVGKSGTTILDPALEEVEERLPMFANMLWGITNAVLCTPYCPDRVTLTVPTETHVEACNARLQDIINITKPLHIVCLGKLAHIAIAGCYTPYCGMITELQHPREIYKKGGMLTTQYRRFVLGLTEALETHCPPPF